MRQGFFYREAREFSEREKSIPAMKGETSTSVCSSSSSRQMASVVHETSQAQGSCCCCRCSYRSWLKGITGGLRTQGFFLIFFRVRFDLFNSRARPGSAPIRKCARPGIAPIKKRAKYFPRKLLNAKALRAPGAPKWLILSHLRVIYQNPKPATKRYFVPHGIRLTA